MEVFVFGARNESTRASVVLFERRHLNLLSALAHVPMPVAIRMIASIEQVQQACAHQLVGFFVICVIGLIQFSRLGHGGFELDSIDCFQSSQSGLSRGASVQGDGSSSFYRVVHCRIAQRRCQTKIYTRPEQEKALCSAERQPTANFQRLALGLEKPNSLWGFSLVAASLPEFPPWSMAVPVPIAKSNQHEK